MSHSTEKATSDVIDISRFVMCCYVVLIHNYSAIEGASTYNVIGRLFSQILPSVGVPAFFFISGFLFFNKQHLNWDIYKYKIKRRFFSLLLPYIIWNSITLIQIIVVQFILNDNNNILDKISGTNLFQLFFCNDDSFQPVACQLWFLRDLYVYALFSPVFYFCATRARNISLLILFVSFVLSQGTFFFNVFMGLSFFYFGIFCKLAKINICKAPRWLLIVYPILLILSWDINSPLLRLLPILGIFFYFHIFNILQTKHKMILMALSRYAFFIYAAHLPILAYINSFIRADKTDLQLSVLYFITPFLVITFLIFAYKAISSITHGKLINILTGR